MKTIKSWTLNPQDARKGLTLYEVTFTPKGKKEKELVYIYAETSLDASNALILRHIWGNQHEIRIHTIW